MQNARYAAGKTEIEYALVCTGMLRYARVCSGKD